MAAGGILQVCADNSTQRFVKHLFAALKIKDSWFYASVAQYVNTSLLE
jgi:hypothetical protein